MIINFLSSTRADFGIFLPLIKQIQNSHDLDYCLYTTGTHYSKEYGNSEKEIINNKIKIHRHINYSLENSTSEELVFGQSEFITKFQKVISRDKISHLVVLGDRFEIAFAAMVCAINGVKVIHLHGGEITLGALDNTFRKIISICSNLHLTSTDVYSTNLIELGLDKNSIYNIGSLAVEEIVKIAKLNKHDPRLDLNIPEKSQYILATIHPETKLSQEENLVNLNCVLNVTQKLTDFYFIFTGSNSDLLGKKYTDIIKGWCKEQRNCFFIHSLGSHNYILTASKALTILGNSSSGIIEIPSLGVPTINLGKRQEGRLSAETVFHLPFNEKQIVKTILAIQKISNWDNTNPYFKKDSSQNAMNIIKAYLHD